MKTKKYLIFSLALFAWFMSACSNDDEPNKGNGNENGSGNENINWQDCYTFNVSEGEATLETVVRTMNDMTIPSEIVIDGQTYPVTKIGDRAFDSNKTVSIIHIPSSIKKIGVFGFYNTNINKLYIEDLGAWCAIDFLAYPDSDDNGYVTYMCFSNPIRSETEIYIGDEKLSNELVIPSSVREVKPFAFEA